MASNNQELLDTFSLIVSDAPGSGGQVATFSGASERVTVANLSILAAIECRVTGKGWQIIPPGCAEGIAFDAASGSSLYLRRTSLEGGEAKANIDVYGVPKAVGTRKAAGVRGGGSNTLHSPTYLHGGASTKNFTVAMSAWGDFDSAQLLFANATTAPALVDNACVGYSATAYPGGASNLRAPSSGWSAGCGPINMPAGASGKNPSFTLSPAFQGHSIPRAAGELDGGKYPLLFANAVILTGNMAGPVGDLGANFPALYDPVNEGFSLQTASKVGADYVANPAGWPAEARETFPVFAIFGAVFSYSQKRRTICPIGDSIMGSGTDGAAQRSPYVFKAAARLRAKGAPVAFHNGSVSGSQVGEINARGKALLATVAPDIVVLAPYTINSPVNTQASWDAQWYSIMDLAQAYLAAGKDVVLTTPCPNNSFGVSQNGYRLVQLQRVRESGFPVIDLEPMCDALGHFRYAEHVMPDGTHWTQTGHEFAAQRALPVLASVV